MPLPTTGNTSNPRSHGYHVQIDDNYWQVVSAPDRPFDLLAQAGRIPTSREFISDPEDVPRSEHGAEVGQVDFSGGEGLDFAHRPGNTPFDETRFWDSEGVKVVSEHGQVQKVELAKNLSKIYTANDSTTWYAVSSQIAHNEGSLFTIDNSPATQSVVRHDDPFGTQSATLENPHAGEAAADLNAICALDGEVYVSLGDGVHRRDSGGTWTHMTGQPPRRLWGLKGRVIGPYLDTELRVYSSTGTTLLKTLPSGEGWRAACDAGAAILVGATNGYVYAYADVDGTLTLRAQTAFPNEEIVGLGAGPGGVVLIGTRGATPAGLEGRLYMGELGSSYTLQNIQLLREWDLNSNLYGAAPSFITFDRDRGYFGVQVSGGADEVWMFDATTTGLFRMETRDFLNTDLAGLVAVDGNVAMVDRLRDLYRQETTFQTSGYLISPLYDHFSAEDKVWAAAKFFGVDLPPNTQARLFYSTNPAALEDNAHASWTPIKTLNNTTGVDDVEVILTNAKSRWITLKMELSTTDVAVTPQIRGFSLRAYAGEGDWEVTVPINVSDVVVRPGRKPTKVPGLGDLRYDTLKTYEGGAVTLTWLYPGETFEGTVKQVGLRSPLQARRGGSLMVAEVQFVGRRT